MDQQLKQAIKFQRGVTLKELSDRVLVASSQDIYALVPVPWQKQVKTLSTTGPVLVVVMECTVYLVPHNQLLYRLFS